MPKKVTITDTSGTVTETTVSDDDTARPYEDLPFESEHIVSVTVTEE
ncbi:hypothetical protein ABZ508_34400 [Streptomyces lavendulocolor]|jgi:hypothetical protein|uniref:Uncharacterized protein n=1 Tax=Streptomyces lavendulocolor TaxID=67316 RepID=A0ABV2WGH6_9ACTN